ncbi:VOC family protein [Phenylobacterium aquaticum]|uniref:VOC family protein n=1 Tax=Phenylobacterium aquaticum TaxID=1763816 RepID=UPI0026F27C2D|nr:VOC family protein [Phenylobacterium aquaticum]
MTERSAIVPVIWYRDPRAAIAWLERAFGFEPLMIVDDGQGGVAHSELGFRGGLVMLVGPPRDHAVSPSQFGGRSTQSVHVQLPDGLDAHCERARAAGARIAREPETQAYGDRVYTCFDPEDHPWSFGQTLVVLSAAQMAEATGHDITTQLERPS